MRGILIFLSITGFLVAQQQNRFQPGIAPFVSVNDPVIALVHVRIIDGTGAPPAEDQTVIIDHGKIAAVGSAASTPVPAGAKSMDLAGDTVIPGLVGMHEHPFTTHKLSVSRGCIWRMESPPRARRAVWNRSPI
jgi:hypothetical protein